MIPREKDGEVLKMVLVEGIMEVPSFSPPSPWVAT